MIRQARPATYDDSILGRPSQSIHQENNVATEQMDAGRQDLKTGHSDYKQRNRREYRKMAIRRTDIQSDLETANNE